MGKLTQLILECNDAEQLARFWQEVLDLPEPEGDADWLTLRWEPVGRFSFHRVPGYRPPEWPGEHGEQQVHFDFSSTTCSAPALWLRRLVRAR